MGMDFETAPVPTREAFQQLVIANVMEPVIGQLWDKAEKIAEDYLNPFIESNTSKALIRTSIQIMPSPSSFTLQAKRILRLWRRVLCEAYCSRR